MPPPARPHGPLRRIQRSRPTLRPHPPLHHGLPLRHPPHHEGLHRDACRSPGPRQRHFRGHIPRHPQAPPRAHLPSHRRHSPPPPKTRATLGGFFPLFCKRRIKRPWGFPFFARCLCFAPEKNP